MVLDWRGGGVPDWRDEIVEAVSAWLAAEEGGGTRRPRPFRIGAARPEGAGGWYLVDLRGKPFNADDLEDLRLAGPNGSRLDVGYRVIQTVQEGEVLRARVGAHVSDSDLHLWATRQASSILVQKLQEGLGALTDPGLADAVARGRFTGLPPPYPEHHLPGRNEAQRVAYAACRVPGAYLVWGPPGTGKTLVLCRAISDLLAAGKRVLLTSSTNIAVDNALAGVMKQRKDQPGRLVRVGTPHLRAIANDPDVCLPQLVAAHCQELEDQRVLVEAELVVIRERAERVAELERDLAGYDHHAYQEAKDLLAAEEQISMVAEQVHQLTTSVEDAARADAAAIQGFERARAAWDEIAEAREHLERAAALERQLQEMDVEVDRLDDELHALNRHGRKLNRELDALESSSWLDRMQRLGDHKRLTRDLIAAQRDHAALDERALVAHAKADQQRTRLMSRIAEHRRAAGLVDTAEVISRQDALVGAKRAAAHAQEHLRVVQQQLDCAQRALLAAEAGPRPSVAQRRLVVDADDTGQPGRHAELEQARQAARRDAKERERLEEEHEALLGKLEQLRRDAEGAIIRQAQLVATTLARVRLHPAVAAGPYHAVLIDEVSAATVPEVLLAAAKAHDTVVLLGDFLQLGPVLPPPIRRSERPDVQRWLLQDCFGVGGITTAEDATRHAGCAVLDTQYRFGPDLMTLANQGPYAGTLRIGHDQPRDPEDPEIVLIDTDGLDDLAVVRRSGASKGWWPAGSLLARVLAQHHLGEGATVGVIAPYGLQVEATLEALRDAEGATQLLGAEVGTAHRFQGREFDVVIFDLVEDDRGDGWVSRGRLDGNDWQRQGARLFNVGATRAIRRLYLISSGRKVHAAPKGTALAPLRAMLAAGRARMIPATELLTPIGAQPALEPDPLVHELAQVLAEYVRVVAIHDEHSFYEALGKDLAAATSSVWIWAPWTTNRLGEVLPLLQDAVQRGVDVTVFVRGDHDQTMRHPTARAWLQRLTETVPRVVRVHDMHQKIVIIDEQVVFLGSLNPLSHHRTRDVMIVQQGQHFAQRLLSHEHAHQFAHPPKVCGQCAQPTVELFRSGSRKLDFSWYWRCSIIKCGWHQEVRLAPDRSPRSRSPRKNPQPPMA
jgi:phosphatidylserine/phosphatidylglycerophosphate/cardiolipin synthase-like enzyme